MLATCSTYFRSIFVSRNITGCGGAGSGCSGHPIVFIPDLSDTVMEHLLSFMYRGETTVQPHLLMPLIDAAKLLGIQGLMDPGIINQFHEQTAKQAQFSEQKLVLKDVEGSTKLNNGEAQFLLPKPATLDEVISRELQEPVEPEKPKPDSSNNSVFPVFPNPLALSQLLSQHLPFHPPQPQQHQQRRPSEPSSSSSANVSSYPGHCPPTEDPTRPFGCTQCPKRFRMKHHLKEHTLIHSGEMPFSCHLCPKRFNRSYTLKNHMKLHSSGAIVDKFQPTCS